MKPVDYMSTREELAKQPAAAALFKRIADAWPVAEERAYVFNAAQAFWCFEHAWDDLMDATVPAKMWGHQQRELAWQSLYNFVDELLLNPFIRSHSLQIRSLLVNAIGKTLEGEALALAESPAVRALAPAVRCADIDVFRGFAELVGGWELMRELGPLWEYDLDTHKAEDK